MRLVSSAFSNQNYLPSRYTCDGLNINPPLSIQDVLPGVHSLAIIVIDPDAPGGDWVHWLVWDIKPATKDIPENTIPLGATQGLNDFGEESYSGPCPPSGTHRYQFKLYALNTTLSADLSSLSKKADLLAAMDRHIIDQTSITGLYHKQ